MSLEKQVALTGIKPTGEPHLGNYIGAIKPALSLQNKYEAYYFIADYHALNSFNSHLELRNYTYQIAASWLACGLDYEKSFFYKQSDIPEIFELMNLLSNFTPKGLMNRAHAYKSLTQKNQEKGRDLDIGINMGLYNYPILMAADILLFQADFIPVGQDQKQHIEIAVDIAQSINTSYKKQLFKTPKPLIQFEQLVLGLDGRKMSKSYKNQIPLFCDEKILRKMIMKITTNSQKVEEKKDPYTCPIFALYTFFASKEERENLVKRYLAGGMGWGTAKQELFEVINESLKSKRELYNQLIADQAEIDRILKKGKEKAREKAEKNYMKIKKFIGLA